MTVNAAAVLRAIHEGPFPQDTITVWRVLRTGGMELDAVRCAVEELATAGLVRRLPTEAPDYFVLELTDQGVATIASLQSADGAG